jgi:hypothetical protein
MGKVYVYENWKSPDPGKMGTLHMDGGKGREVVSFECGPGQQSDRFWIGIVRGRNV